MIACASLCRALLILWMGLSGTAWLGCVDAGDGSGVPPATDAVTSEAGEAGPAGTVRPAAAASPPERAASGSVVFIGTSLTAGYGLDDPALAYPALIGRRIADAGGGCRVVNAGVSGDTSAGGRARLGQLLGAQQLPLAALFVELGANDGLRGQSPEALYDNLAWIVGEARRQHPEAAIVVAGMEAPTNLGPAYTRAFRDVFPRVAKEHGTVLIPFLLKGVAAVPALNQSDGIHPNAEGHGAMAAHVWSVLGDDLTSRCAAEGTS